MIPVLTIRRAAGALAGRPVSFQTLEILLDGQELKGLRNLTLTMGIADPLPVAHLSVLVEPDIDVAALLELHAAVNRRRRCPHRWWRAITGHFGSRTAS
jgi:hypothetical protein